MYSAVLYAPSALGGGFLLDKNDNCDIKTHFYGHRGQEEKR